MVVHVLNYKEHFSTVLLPQDQHLHFHPSADDDESDPAPPTFPGDEYNNNFPPLQRSQQQRQSGASQHHRQQQRQLHNLHDPAHPQSQDHDKCDKPAQHLEAQVKVDSRGLAPGSQGHERLQHDEGVEHDGGHVVGNDNVCTPGNKPGVHSSGKTITFSSKSEIKFLFRNTIYIRVLK